MSTDPDHLSPREPLPGEPERRVVRTEYKFSHVTTGRYLPTPGKAPGWLSPLLSPVVQFFAR